jgi:hypothetical protein
MPDELTVKVHIDSQQLRKQVLDSIEETINTKVTKLFASGTGQGKGMYYEVLESFLNSKFLDPDVQKTIEAMAESMWPEILKAAVTKALEHKANKLAFTVAKGKLEIDAEHF